MDAVDSTGTAVSSSSQLGIRRRNYKKRDSEISHSLHFEAVPSRLSRRYAKRVCPDDAYTASSDAPYTVALTSVLALTTTAGKETSSSFRHLLDQINTGKGRSDDDMEVFCAKHEKRCN